MNVDEIVNLFIAQRNLTSLEGDTEGFWRGNEWIHKPVNISNDVVAEVLYRGMGVPELRKTHGYQYADWLATPCKLTFEEFKTKHYEKVQS